MHVIKNVHLRPLCHSFDAPERIWMGAHCHCDPFVNCRCHTSFSPSCASRGLLIVKAPSSACEWCNLPRIPHLPEILRVVNTRYKLIKRFRPFCSSANVLQSCQMIPFPPMCAQILLLLLSQDPSFASNIHLVALPGGAPWCVCVCVCVCVSVCVCMCMCGRVCVCVCVQVFIVV